MINATNLSKKYSGQTVLEIQTWRFPEPKFGLVGNNGAGKTTLFSLFFRFD